VCLEHDHVLAVYFFCRLPASSSSSTHVSLCIFRTSHHNTPLHTTLLQAASKLILINAFVDAHTSAQQLISRHLAQLSAAQAADAESSLNNSSSSCRTGNSPAGASAYDAAKHDAASPAAAVMGGASSSSSSKGRQQQMQGAEQQEEEACGELEAARLVLQESQNEVTAALQYAQEVGVGGEKNE
jgi:hypothetical protein